MTDRSSQWRPLASATLIIAAADAGHGAVTDCVAGLGRRFITVCHPLEAIACLQDDSVPIDVVLAPAHDLGFATLEWFAFMRVEFPRVLRIAYQKSSPKIQGHCDKVPRP